MDAAVGMSTVRVHIRNSISHAGFTYKQGREYDIDHQTAAQWVASGHAFIVKTGRPAFSIERAVNPPDAETGLAVPAVQAAGEDLAPAALTTGRKRKPRPRRVSSKGREKGGAMSASQAF